MSYHKTLDMKTYENDLEDISYVFVELPKFKREEGELKTVQDKWIYFFKNWSATNHVPSDVQESEILEAYNAMEQFNWTALEKEAYLKANIALTEEFAVKKEQYEKGLKEGREKGRREAKLNMAKDMLTLGLLKEQIQKITNLTSEDLADL